MTQAQEPLSEEEIAADLGGSPKDYNADTYHVGEPVADGDVYHANFPSLRRPH